MKAAHDRGLTHLAITDHDRIDVALEARELAPAGLTVIVGEEVKTARRRPDLRLPRAGDPAGAVGGGDDRGGAGAGRAGRHPASVRPDARLDPARRVDGEPGAAGRLGRDAQRARRRPRQRGRRRRSRSSTGCPASRSPTRIRSWRSASPTSRSTAIRRRRPACSPRSPTAEIVPGRATLLRPALDADRQGRQPGPRQRPRRAGRRARPTPRRAGMSEQDGTDGQDHRTDGRESTRGPVR